MDFDEPGRTQKDPEDSDQLSESQFISIQTIPTIGAGTASAILDNLFPYRNRIPIGSCTSPLPFEPFAHALVPGPDRSWCPRQTDVPIVVVGPIPNMANTLSKTFISRSKVPGSKSGNTSILHPRGRRSKAHY
jgi:hypothetical protein